MDLLSAPATPLQSSASAFNASDSVQDLLGVTTNHLGASTIITVNSIADVVDNNDGVTTLREAINFANADTGNDVIVFDRSLFSTQQTISLNLGELDITHNLSIIAPRDSLTGGDLMTVSGNKGTRVLEIGSGATVNLSGLVIADGLVTNDNGGGINNSGTLTLDSSVVRNNSARYGGGIYNTGTGTVQVSNSTLNGDSSIYYGGGIYNTGTGTVQVSNSTLNGNSAGGDGGGIYNTGTGIVQVNNSTLSSNRGSGIFNNAFGTLEVSNSTISGNTGNGIFNGYHNDSETEDFRSKTTVVVNDSTISGNSAQEGSGIYNYQYDAASIFEVSNSTISGNSATKGIGGGIYSSGSTPFKVSNSTISGNSATSAGGGIYKIGGTFEVSNSTISGNSATQGIGGGILNTYGTMNVSNSTISDNSATLLFYDGGFGGGISNSGSQSTVNVSNSTISGNSANGGGGGIFNGGIMNLSNSTLSGNSAGNNGGGIFNGMSALSNSYPSNFNPIVTVNNSTLRGNSAGNNGGGIFNGISTIGSNSNNPIVTVNNSTLSDNTAGSNGGGIFNNRTVALVFSTLTLNQAIDGSGVFNLIPGSAVVRNTIIASNLPLADGLNPDVAGSFTSNGYNLIGDSTGSIGFDQATGDIVGTSDNPIDPRLGSLDANGGPTQTHALLEDSPAIDAGDPTVLDTDPTTDQRGFPRVSGARADIGAFEFSSIV